MKAYSFYFNATDWLASPSVKLMTKAERGCYIDLLAIAWNQKEPGTLPASEDKVRRLAELTPAEWEVSGEALLEVFPLSECQTFRYNQRLLDEVAKQRELSEKNARNGQKSAERRAAEKAAKEAAAATEAQRLANQKATVVAPNPTTVEPTGNHEGNQSSTKLSQAKQLTIVSKDAGEPAPEPPAKPKTIERRLPLPPDDVELFNASNWPSLTDPQKFANVCATLGYPQVDFELYRHQIGASLDGKELPASSLRKWIESYLNRDKAEGRLLVPVMQTPNERPSNYTGTAPYVAPLGSRIPDMSSIINPNWKPPQA